MNIKKEIKGFTLVELLSVIALLAVLAIIAIPNISKLLKSSREDLYSKQISSIITSAKLWATEEENMILLEENEVWPFILTLSDLQTSGFIDNDIKNPKTDEKIPESLLIYINKVNNKYSYSVDESSDDTLAPIITMNGDKVVTLEIKSNYSDAGATAVRPDGTSNPITTVIKKKGVTSSIDSNQIGIYTITYSSEYEIGGITHKAVAVRALKFVDTTKPVITCSSCVDGTIIESTDTYTLPSVTVTDNSGEVLNAIITGSFSSKIPGEKNVIYQATDSSGNTGTLEVKYVVKDTIAPEFTYKIIDTNTFEIIATDSGSGVKEYSFDDGKNWQKSNVGKYIFNDVNDVFTHLAVKDYSGNIAKKKVIVNCFNVPVGTYVKKDSLDEERIVYYGDADNNYIKLKENGVEQDYRIVSIESDGTIKVIRQNSITSMPYDSRTSETEGRRLNSNNTYCKQWNGSSWVDSGGVYYGCNAWNKVNGTYNNNGLTGTVTEDAEINTYLNTTFYNLLDENVRNNIVTHSFNTTSNEWGTGLTSLTSLKNATVTWEGKIGLLEIRDWFNATSNESCDSSLAGSGWYKEGITTYACAQNNYLHNSTTWWLMSPDASTRNGVFSVYSAGYANCISAYGSLGVRPVFYLSSNIAFSGDGTSGNPYRINP